MSRSVTTFRFLQFEVKKLTSCFTQYKDGIAESFLAVIMHALPVNTECVYRKQAPLLDGTWSTSM